MLEPLHEILPKEEFLYSIDPTSLKNLTEFKEFHGPFKMSTDFFAYINTLNTFKIYSNGYV